MLTSDAMAEWAKKGAKLGDCGRMCDDCAFKKGTSANMDPGTVENFMLWFDLTNPDAKFYCHTNLPEGVLIDKTKVCAGFLYVRQYFEQLKK